MEKEIPSVRADNLFLFNGMTATARAALLKSTMAHSGAPGTILFEQGEAPNFQHIVLSGSAHLFGRSSDGKEVLIEIVRAPDLIIPAAVMTASPYLMQARVLEPSRFLLIPADALRIAIKKEPALAQAMIESLAGQFRRMVRQIKNLKLRSSTQRVGSYILALSTEQKNPSRVVLPYEKNLIASELGMTRESFSRTLSALQRDGISVQGDTIVITNAERLATASGVDPLIDID